MTNPPEHATNRESAGTVEDPDRDTATSVPPVSVEDDDDTVDRSVLIGIGGRWLSDWALRLSILLVTAWLLYKIGAVLWVGILPLLLALIVSTVLWPPVRFLRRLGLPAGLAAALSLVGSLALVGGIIAIVAPSVVSQSVELADKASLGLTQVRDMLKAPPLNVNDAQIDLVVDKANATLQEKSSQIANGVFSGVTAVSSALVTLLLVVVLTFFFIKDGPKFLPWVRRIVGRQAGRHLTEVFARSWNTLSGFIRTQAVVSMVDAVFIGAALVFLKVPLAWALAVITFLAGFIPIVGAVTAGALAVLIALVANGPTTAIIVLVVIILVQQLESNVLQPILQSKAMNLHPVVVLLVVAAGGTLYGIVGAFLAVPVAAVAAVGLRYLGEQIDLRTGDVVASDVNTVTDEGRLTAWLGELSSSRFEPLRRGGTALLDGITAATQKQPGRADADDPGRAGARTGDSARRADPTDPTSSTSTGSGSTSISDARRSPAPRRLVGGFRGRRRGR